MTAPRRVGVLGGGRMGAGIAHAFLLAGSRGRRRRTRRRLGGCRDRTRARQHRAFGAIEAAPPRARSSSCDAALSTGTDAAAFVDCDLVIEAVPEDRALKTEALARAERAMPAASVLAIEHVVHLDRRPLGAPRAARAVPRPPLLQPGAGVEPRRGRPRLRHWRRPRRRGTRLDRRDRQDRDRGARLARLRLEPARRGARAGGDPDARGGRGQPRPTSTPR